MGLPAAYLEVEARDGGPTPRPTDRLLVLGRLELGTDPVDVADVAAAPPRPRGTPGGGPARSRG